MMRLGTRSQRSPEVRRPVDGDADPAQPCDGHVRAADPEAVTADPDLRRQQRAQPADPRLVADRRRQLRARVRPVPADKITPQASQNVVIVIWLTMSRWGRRCGLGNILEEGLLDVDPRICTPTGHRVDHIPEQLCGMAFPI